MPTTQHVAVNIVSIKSDCLTRRNIVISNSTMGINNASQSFLVKCLFCYSASAACGTTERIIEALMFHPPENLFCKKQAHLFRLVNEVGLKHRNEMNSSPVSWTILIMYCIGSNKQINFSSSIAFKQTNKS